MALGPEPRQGWDFKRKCPCPASHCPVTGGQGGTGYRQADGIKGHREELKDGERENPGVERRCQWHTAVPPKSSQVQNKLISWLHLQLICVCRIKFPEKFHLVPKENNHEDIVFCPVVCPHPRNVIAGMWTQADSSFLHIWNSFGMGKDFLKDWKKKSLKSNLAFG